MLYILKPNETYLYNSKNKKYFILKFYKEQLFKNKDVYYFDNETYKYLKYFSGDIIKEKLENKEFSLHEKDDKGLFKEIKSDVFLDKKASKYFYKFLDKIDGYNSLDEKNKYIDYFIESYKDIFNELGYTLEKNENLSTINVLNLNQIIDKSLNLKNSDDNDLIKIEIINEKIVDLKICINDDIYNFKKYLEERHKLLIEKNKINYIVDSNVNYKIIENPNIKFNSAELIHLNKGNNFLIREIDRIPLKAMMNDKKELEFFSLRQNELIAYSTNNKQNVVLKETQNKKQNFQ